jgi:hypothetical protein
MTRLRDGERDLHALAAGADKQARALLAAVLGVLSRDPDRAGVPEAGSALAALLAQFEPLLVDIVRIARGEANQETWGRRGLT